MPQTGYLKIGDIPGESQRVDHEEEIDVFDIAWGIERTSSAFVGRGRARSRTDMKPLVVRKYVDASSVYLALAVRQGKSFPDMVLSVRKDSGEAHLDYLVITMENVIITSYNVASDESGQLSEEIEIDFEEVTLRYTRQNDDGSAGDEHEATLTI